MTAPLTAFNGLLTRTSAGWRWIDGADEPRVHDLAASKAFQFNRVTYADPSAPEGRARWIQIPSATVREEPDLREVLDLARDSMRRNEHTPSLIELPEAVWDAWAEHRIVGLIWDAADEKDLMATAERLRASRAR